MCLGIAAALHEIRGMNTPCTGLSRRESQPHSEYGADQPVFLFQPGLGFGCYLFQSCWLMSKVQEILATMRFADLSLEWTSEGGRRKQSNGMFRCPLNEVQENGGHGKERGRG